MKQTCYFFTVFPLLFLAFIPRITTAQDAPQLQQPADGATGLPTEITFEWGEVSSADTYQIHVSDTLNFQNILVEENTPDTSITISGFNEGQTYYWRVRAGDVILTIVTYGDWSDTWSFSTAPPAPAAPELISPTNGKNNVTISPLLNWNHSEHAESYRVQLSETENFFSVSEDHSNISDSEIHITDLQTGTSYYWRVNATNQSGTGDWSETWTFTTATDPPPAPNLMAPEDGAEDVSTSIMLEWESVEEADSYDFQIALNENFNNTVVNQQGVSSTHYNGNFEEYTTHYWRVRSKNQGGDSVWSAVWKFTTEQGDNAMVLQAPSGNELLRGSENYTIRWHATNKIDKIDIEYSTDNENWIPIAEGVNASDSSYSWAVPDSSSTDTQIRITDSQNPEIYTVSMPFLLYPSSLQLQHSYSFNSARSSSDYKLIGLPANNGVSADNIFTGRAGQDWILFHDNGEGEDYLVPYDTTDVFTFRPGRGFWAISKPNVQISESTGSVELSADTTYAIQLHQGWNIISNPFAKPVSWSSVQEKNNISDPLWTFEGTFRESPVLDRYKGYYFYNRSDMEELHIPYVSKSPTDKTDQQRYRSLSLNLIRNGKKMSFIEAGIQSNGKPNTSIHYDPAPPGDFQEYQITIQNDSLVAGGQPHLTRLFYSDSADAYSFDLSVVSASGEPVALEVEGVQHFNFDEILLIHNRSKKTYDLRKNTSLRIDATEAGENYTLFIGRSDSINDLREQKSSKSPILFQNYPNPFNNQTVIEYSVDQRMANSRVVLEIFNVLGQQVALLVNERQPAGSYQVNWNAENSAGRELASGVYIYRLQVGDIVKIRRLTLLK